MKNRWNCHRLSDIRRVSLGDDFASAAGSIFRRKLSVGRPEFQIVGLVEPVASISARHDPLLGQPIRG